MEPRVDGKQSASGRAGLKRARPPKPLGFIVETEKRKLHKAMVARTPSQTCSVKERKLLKKAARLNMMTRLPLQTDAPLGRSFLEEQAVSAVTRLSYEQAIAGFSTSFKGVG